MDWGSQAIHIIRYLVTIESNAKICLVEGHDLIKRPRFLHSRLAPRKKSLGPQAT